MSDCSCRNVNASIEKLLLEYFDACNTASSSGVAACLAADVVHYFPSPKPSIHGSDALGEYFAKCVSENGYVWTVDEIFVDPIKERALIEWSQFFPSGKLVTKSVVRGVDVFFLTRQDDKWLIKEIRAYLAAKPGNGADIQLHGLDYKKRGYPVELEITGSTSKAKWKFCGLPVGAAWNSRYLNAFKRFITTLYNN